MIGKSDEEILKDAANVLSRGVLKDGKAIMWHGEGRWKTL